MLHIFTLSVLLSLGGQSAQDPPLSAAPTELEDVIVEGRRLRNAVDDFVDNIVAPPVGRGPARWHRNVCVGVANLRPESARAIADQVSVVAWRAGLLPGEPGCEPNILVIASDDGSAMAKALVETRPRVFRPQYSGAARSSEALERFQSTTAPVRWWHVSIPVSRDTGEAAVKLPGRDPPIISQDASRITTRVRNDLRRAFVIVDMSQIGDLTSRQLGDYIGMVALAQIDPDADTASYDTVLNLFDDAPDVQGVTEWDVSYLSSLYGAELNRRATNQQAGEVSSIMLRDRRRAQEEAGD